MIRSIYQAASALMAQMTRQLTISHNLSNVSTPGYKQQISPVTDFRDMLLNRIGDGQVSPVGSLSTAVRPDETTVDLSQGALVETGNPLDLALAGDGFFAIQAPDGVQYTRDGTFHLDAARQLVTSDGLPVLGENGPLTLPDGEILVDADGTIRVNGQVAGRLQLISFPADADITPVGDNRFQIEGAGQPSPTAGVSQGFLEHSNVDLNQTVVDMMGAARSYALAQRMLQVSDQSLSLAVNDIGRVV